MSKDTVEKDIENLLWRVNKMGELNRFDFEDSVSKEVNTSPSTNEILTTLQDFDQRREKSSVGTSPVVSTMDFIKRTMSFADCLLAILDGSKARRQEWPDNGTYITMREGKVMIFNTVDNLLHPLIVTDGDILGDDWTILTEKS